MIAWIGTLSSVAGSFLVAFGMLTIGYPAFTLGALSWVWVAFKRKDRALLTLNLVFLTANIVGLARSF